MQAFECYNKGTNMPLFKETLFMGTEISMSQNFHVTKYFSLICFPPNHLRIVCHTKTGGRLDLAHKL